MNFTNALNVHADLPLTGIVTVHESDIICGRGGLSLKHPGNAAYRQITSLNKEIYATCPKSEKMRISKSIVNAVREINARFLEREDGKTSQSLDETDAAGKPVTWRDIGDKRAIEKTSQALREGQPKLLKKLKKELDHMGDNVQDETGVNFSIPLNHGGTAPHLFSHAQPLQQGMLGDVQMFGNQPPSQLQPESFTLTSLVGTQTMSSPSSLPLGFSQFGDAQRLQEGIDSADDIKHVRTKNDSSNTKKSENWLHNSTVTTDSWGEVDPMPIPFNEVATQNGTVGHVFSNDDSTQLMRCLSVFDDGSGSTDAKSAPKRSSVRFQLDGNKHKSDMSLMSGVSYLSEWLNSSAQSLDSAMEAAEREAELENIGEFNFSGSGERLTFDMSWGKINESFGQHHGTAEARRSILKRSNYPMTSAASHHADPGLIFTSTLDSKPGGVNAGTDVSGILGDNVKSDEKFISDFCRRRSSRTALSDFSVSIKRDFGTARSMGSMLSIQSADFRELFQGLDSDSD